MHLLASETKNSPQSTLFTKMMKVTDEEGLRRAVETDHVCVMLDGGRRADDNFLFSDCIGIDVDNQNNKKPYTISQFLQDFKRYKAFAVTSKSHLKDKHGKVCDRFHIYFPISVVHDRGAYSDLKRKLAEMCHSDGDSLDVSRLFFGAPESAQIFQTGGRRLIDNHPKFARADWELAGRVFRVSSKFGGMGKTTLLRHLMDILGDECEVLGTTWNNSRNISYDCKTWQASRITRNKNNKGVRVPKRKFKLIDEASMLKKEDFEAMRKANPLACFILFGDGNQLNFKDNAIEMEEFPMMWLKNTENPRITDFRLIAFIEGLLEGKIDEKFIENRQSNPGRTPVISFKNSYCQMFNLMFDFSMPGIRIKSKFNSKKTSNNELWTIKNTNEWTTTIVSERGNEEIIPTKQLYETFTTWDDAGEPRETRKWEIAEAITIFSAQGKTMDRVAVDVFSMYGHCKHTHREVVHMDSLIRGLLSACSRVRSADDLFFLGTIKDLLVDKEVVYDYEKWVPENMEDFETNCLTKMKKEEFCDLLVMVFKGGDNRKKKPVKPPADSEDHREERGFVDMNLNKFEHGEGNRNQFMTKLCGCLNKKKAQQAKRGYPFDSPWALNYAQSIVQMDESVESMAERLLR